MKMVSVKVENEQEKNITWLKIIFISTVCAAAAAVHVSWFQLIMQQQIDFFLQGNFHTNFLFLLRWMEINLTTKIL